MALVGGRCKVDNAAFNSGPEDGPVPVHDVVNDGFPEVGSGSPRASVHVVIHAGPERRVLLLVGFSIDLVVASQLLQKLWCGSGLLGEGSTLFLAENFVGAERLGCFTTHRYKGIVGDGL